jgi:chromosome segregation ATPase
MGMIDSLLDSVSKKVDKIHNVTDVAVREVHRLAKEVVSSSGAIKEANEAAELVSQKLQEAESELAGMRHKLKEAEQQIQIARFQALEASAVMDTLESMAGNAAQFAQPESKELMVQNDPRLFEQSAGLLNPKDLERAIGRLNLERVKMIYGFCAKVIEAEANDTESA